MWLKEKLKKTPLRKMYWKLLGTWPIAPIRHAKHERRKDLLWFHTYPDAYDQWKQAPVDENKVLFIEMRIGQLGNSFTYLYKVLTEEYNFDVHVHYLRDTFVKPKVFEQNCMKMLEDLATAKYVFVSEASHVLSCVRLRPETVVTQLWHACGAFKRFGMSTADKIFGLDAAGQRKHPLYKNYSYVTVSSPEIIWAYAEAMDLQDRKEIIRPVGTSRTDVFYQKEAIDAAYAHVYEKFPAARGKKIILFAPTFRGRISYPTTSMPDLNAFYARLGKEYVVILKHHPLVRDLPKVPEQYQGSFVYDATRTMDIEDLLMVSDICISDYSSLIFEYSLFERPMLFYAYDLDDYFDWRGFYYDYDELTPGPVCKTNEEMIAWIENVEHTFDKQRVIDFKNKFMASCDGHATERVLELTMGQEALDAHRVR